MAWEITELLKRKLNLLFEDINYSKSKSDQCIKELEKFQEILKGADDHEENTHPVKEWVKLVRDIYSLEDIIEPLICRSGTTLKCQEVLLIKMRLTNNIGKLTNKVRKLVTTSSKTSSESGAGKPPISEDNPRGTVTDAEGSQIRMLLSSNSNDVQVQAEAVHIQSTYAGDMQQLPTSSESGARIPPISEDNPPGTVTDREGSQIGMLLPSNSNDVQDQPEAVHIQSTYSGDMQQPPTSSESGAGTPPISEDNQQGTVTDPEGSPNLPRFDRTDSVGAQLLPPRRLQSRKWSSGRLFLEDVDKDAIIPDDSDDICGKTVEALVNKLAQPVLSSSKLQCLMLKADVSSSSKAILLSAVYNAETVKQHFHCRAWINVSELSEAQIVNAILEECNYNKEKDGEALRSPQQRLHDFLVWKRFLIVLHGVKEGFRWDDLEPIIPYSLNGSRVILVTPHSEGSKSFGKASDERLKQYLVKSSGYLEEDFSIISAKAVVDELTESILSRHRLSFLISFVGVVGSGKTTLLRAMYDAEVIKSHFDCCAWVHVPEVFKERDLLTDIWGQVAGDKKDILLPLKSLRQKLRSFLAHKMYLVVLYDLWTAETWECIKISLPNSLNGSRVVLDVQEVDVARKTDSWIFKITSRRELLHDLKDMQENASEKKHATKRWESLSDIMDRASVIVGLEDKLRELAKLVLNNYRLHFLVSVLGAAGSGKTTVVRTFYNSIASKQHFECRAWISVPQDFEEKDILLDLFRQLRKVKENRSLSVEQLRMGLSLFLTRKRYLIVLDDVRTPEIWSRLNVVFPNSSNGSRVILTIRKAYLAYHMNPPAVVLSLRPLSNKESWELFKEKVQDVSDIPSNLKEKILRRCGGVPLTVVVLGGLLSTKNRAQNYKEWFDVMGQTNKPSEKKKGMTGKDPLNSFGRVASLESKQKHEKNEVTMANQVGSSNGEEKNFIEDQSSSLVQQFPSDAKGKDNKRKTPEYTTTGEDQLTDPNQVALFATEQNEEMKMATDIGNATSAEDQSTSSDESTSPAEISLSNTVAVTYQHLSFSSKCCLLYLGLFPRQYEIPVRRLLQLWLAEGLVTQPTGETKPLEVLVERCFDELLRTNMIEVAKRSLDGSPKTCRVTNTLYDTLLLNAEKVGFFHIHSSSGTSPSQQSNIRRLAEHLDMYMDSKHSVICIQHLRTYISFYKKKGDAPTSGVGELLNKIVKGGVGMLVVLDLEGVYKPMLSEILGKLRQLKYLGLRRTLLDSVPESVGGLPHLETLDIKQTYIITMPSTIWEAKKLRHLYMSEIYVDVSIQKTSAPGSLSDLQTLWGLIIRRKTTKTWLYNLTKLRKLKLTYLETSMEGMADWLSKLSNLESLKLRSISDSNEPASLVFGGMKNLTNLSRLYLLGRLPGPLKDNELPPNLVVLTLSVSRLSEDPMKVLAELLKLKVLRLYAHSFEGTEMKCHHDGFPELLELKLWMLDELVKWTVEDNAMQKLKELEIRCCKKLTEVNGLEKLTSLKKLTITDMKPPLEADKKIYVEPPFVADVEKKIGGQIEIKKDFWKFLPPWE